MKSLILKLLVIILLAVAMIAVAPEIKPLIDRMISPPEVGQVKQVTPPVGIRHLEQVEDLVFEMTNQARKEQGAKPLIKDEKLRRIAQANSDDMLVRHFFSHTDPNGISFDKRISRLYPHWVFALGENIWMAESYNPNKSRQLAQIIVDSWMKSPGHRENLLNPAYTHLGVGISARHNEIRATQEFVLMPKAFFFGGNK